MVWNPVHFWRFWEEFWVPNKMGMATQIRATKQVQFAGIAKLSVQKGEYFPTCKSSSFTKMEKYMKKQHGEITSGQISKMSHLWTTFTNQNRKDITVTQSPISALELGSRKEIHKLCPESQGFEDVDPNSRDKNPWLSYKNWLSGLKMRFNEIL